MKFFQETDFKCNLVIMLSQYVIVSYLGFIVLVKIDRSGTMYNHNITLSLSRFVLIDFDSNCYAIIA